MSKSKRSNGLKLRQKDYWMSRYDGLPLGRDSEVRQHFRNQMDWNAGTDLVFVHLPLDAPIEEVKRALRIYAEEGVFYAPMLSDEGTAAYSLRPELVRAILSDEFIGEHFVGLFMGEPCWTPSLRWGTDSPKTKFWFDETHYHIPCHYGRIPHGIGIGYGPELRPEHGGIVEPLPKPIENPLEALEAWRVAFQRWAKPFLDEFSGEEALMPDPWSGSKAHFYTAYFNAKFAMALHPFAHLSPVIEINNQDYSAAFAEMRGIERAGGGPWGCRVGGVRWKYHQLWARAQGLFSSPDASNYGATLDLPNWIFFIPFAECWAEGGRIFMCEHPEYHLSTPQRRPSAVRSFREMLAKAGPPMDPEIRLALLKGNGYFVDDVPGYETGMKEEILSGMKYQVGRNSGEYTPDPPSFIGKFYPRTNATHEGEDAVLSGNPYGSLDFLPNHAPAESLQRYDRVVVVDWNCLDDEIYGRLLGYAKQGGKLVIAGAQLISQREGKIKWEDPPKEAFFRNGDLSELCGLVLAGGSARCEAVLKGPCLFADPDSQPEPSDLFLYRAEGLSKGAEALAATPDGQPVIVRNNVGKGTVMTVLGPSYSAALGDYAHAFLEWLARENRTSLSYRIARVTAEEEKDLIVHRDLGSKRVALCNYWRRFDMTPRVTLRDGASDAPTVEKIDVYDSDGFVSSWESPAKVRDKWETYATLPMHSLGLVRYEEGRDPDRFRFAWRVIRTQHFYATHENVSSTSRRVGPVEVFTTRDVMSTGGAQPLEADVWSWIELRVLDCPAGKWHVSVEVQESDGKPVRGAELDVEVKAGKPLVLPKEVSGNLFGRWLVTVEGQRTG